MMIKIVIVIAESESINLPIQPLVWAVAFGPCLGGTTKYLRLPLLKTMKATINFIQTQTNISFIFQAMELCMELQRIYYALE